MHKGEQTEKMIDLGDQNFTSQKLPLPISVILGPADIKVVL